MRRKLLSLLLVMAMVCSLVPSALAAGDTVVSKTQMKFSPASLTFANSDAQGQSLSATVTWPADDGFTYTTTGYHFESADSTKATVSQAEVSSSSSGSITVTPKAAGTTSISVYATGTRKGSDPDSKAETVKSETASASVTVSAPTSTLSLNVGSITTSGSGTALTATVTNAPAGSYVRWTVSSGGTGVTLRAPSEATGGTSKDITVTNGASTVHVDVAATASATITAQLYNSNQTIVSGASATCTVSVSSTAKITLTPPTYLTNGTGMVQATISGVPNTSGYEIRWTAGGAVLGTTSPVGAGATHNLTTQLSGSTTSSVYLYTTNTTGTVTVQASLYTTNSTTTPVATSGVCTIYVNGTNTDFSLTRNPSSTSTVYLNRYYYNDIYNSNWYNRTASFTVTPIIGSSSVNTANSYDIRYSWSITPTTYSSGALSVTDRAVGSSGYTYGGSTATVDAYYLNSSNTSYTLTCNAYAYTKGTTTNPVKTTSTSWTIRTDYTYHNYGSISASATVYANSTGYSLGSTDDAGSTSIVSELQSAVSSRYGYGSGWNSDRYYWDNSRSAWIDRTTGSIVSYDYNWNGWGNGWNNGYGYDTLRYVTFSSVSTTGGSLSASTGTRYHVGGRTSYGSSALENVVFTPNGKSSTASFNITAYGDYGTYSGTITFNMSGTATPTTLTMSGTAGQNLNFKTSDFTSWWKGMYPSGNLSYVRFTSCSAGSLTNGVNGSSVVGNSTSCYASARSEEHTSELQSQR